MICSLKGMNRQKATSDMWQYYNPNPVRQSGVGDCAVRAVAKALDLTWEQAFARLAVNAFLMGDVISSDVVWGSVLREAGFRREILPNECPDCVTVEQFCEEHPEGVYVLKSYNHVATAVSGTLYDGWDSSQNVVIYYWTKEDKTTDT